MRCSTRKILILSALGAMACTSATTVDIQLQPEASIRQGIAAGSGRGQIADGWTLTYAKYIVSVGDVSITDTAFPAITVPSFTAVDLKTLPETGLSLATVVAPTGQRHTVSYALRAATSTTTRHTSVTPADLDEMIAGACSHLIEGTITKPNGQSAPGGFPRPAPEIRFHFCVDLNVTFGPCESGVGMQGLNVTGATTVAALTLHGDHLVFPGFPNDESGVLVRRAQWLANADGSGDNMVTKQELQSIQASQLIEGVFPASALTGSPLSTINTGWDYVRAQLASQGHLAGEGECTQTVAEE